VLFGLVSGWLHVPALGLFAYLVVLAIAVLSPAIWAARGARGLERVVVIVALGAAATPAWAVIDRANSVGLLAPVGLGFLLALCRQRWAVVAVMVVLAALVRPQFAMLVVVLFAARQWRMGAIALAGTVMSNLAAYLLWPQEFPDTIRLSIHNALHFDSVASDVGVWNVSFAKGLLLLPDSIAAFNSGGRVPEGFLAGPRSLIGYVVLVVVVLCVLGLGRRIPPVMAGVALLATASLASPLTYHYYLVFALPVAAVVARDPDGPPGSGIFDRLGTSGDRRRAIGACVCVAVAFSIAQIVLPVGGPTLYTTRVLVPGLWLLCSAVMIVSYARRPSPVENMLILGEAPADGKVH
jgi:hypothetical protein